LGAQHERPSPAEEKPVKQPDATTVYVKTHVNTVHVLTERLKDSKWKSAVELYNAIGLFEQETADVLKSIRPPNRTERIVFGITNRLFDPYGLNRIGIDKGPLDGKSLMQLTDWVPSAAVRKRQKKLIADEIAEINEFRAKARMGLARWRRVWLALHWLCYLLGAPIAAVVRIAKKTSAG
jgi:hypothetical protein